MFLCLGITVLLYPQTASANLALNGNFEGGTTGWSGGTADASVYHWGSKSLRVEDLSSNNWISAYTTDSINISPENRYLLEVWARGANADQELEFGIQQFDENDKWISGNNKVTDVTVGQKWNLVQVLLENFHPQATSVRIFLSPTNWTSDGGHQGIAYFDDLAFQPYSDNLIQNGDFENGDNGWYGGGSITSSIVHSGTASMLINDSSRTKAIQEGTQGFIPVFQDKSYLLQTWIRGIEAGQSVQVTVSQYTVSSKEHGDPTHIGGKNFDFTVKVGTGWTRFVQLIETLDARTKWVSISIRPAIWNSEGTYTGKAYFDDIRLELYDGNLLINSGFEYGSTGWDGDTIQVDHDRTRNGSGALLIEDNDAQLSLRGYSTQFTPVLPETSYLLQAWIYGEGTAQSVWVAVNQFDKNKNWIHGNNIDHVVIVGPQWKLFQQVIRHLHPDAAFVQLSLYPAGWTRSGSERGKAWFDDVRLIQYEGNLIENGSFERGLIGWQGGELSTEAHQGNQSLQISDASSTISVDAHSVETIPVISDEIYSLTAWVQTSIPSEPLQLTVNQYDANENWISGKNMDFVVQAGSEWSCYQTYIDDLQATTTSVRTFLRPVRWTSDGAKVGSAEFDQVNLRLQDKLVEGTWLPSVGDMQFWWAPPDLKVQRGLTLDGSASSSKSISLAAGRGEGESFQLVLLPQRNDTLLKASASNFSGPGTILSSQAEIREVAYVPIAESSDRNAYHGCEEPDPLPNLGRLDLKAGVQQPLWITIHIPDGISAGNYRGEVVLEFKSMGSISVPVELEVWDFDLPNEHHLRTAYGLSMGQINHYHGLNGDLDDKDAVMQLYMDEFSSHRISPYDPIGDDWYKLIFWNLNWVDGEFVADPIRSGNQVLVVKDEGSSAAYVQSSAPITIDDTTTDYNFSWEALVGGSRNPAGNEYFISIRQFDDNDQWISGANIDIARDPKVLDRWGSETISIDRGRWHADVDRVRIALYARHWTPGSSTGTTWYDNLSFVKDGTSVNLVQNPGFNPVAAKDLEVRLETKRFDDAVVNAFNLNFDSIRASLPYFGACSLEGGVKKPNLLDWAWGTQDYADAYENVVQAIANHLEVNGWLDKFYAYWCDEPKESWMSDVVYGMEILGAGAPDLNRLLTLNHTTDEANLLENVDIWVPQPKYFDAAFAKERQNAGDEYWWYVSTGINHPYSNNFIDYPGIDIRARFWSAWKYDIEGSLYWETTYWSNTIPCTSCQDPWEDPQSYSGTGSQFGNGDGRLLYPPRNWKSSSGPLIEGPVPSLRWELIRESLEDYELFWMLQEAKARLKARNPSDPLVAKAEDLLSIPESLIASLTDFETDPREYAGYRYEMGETLVEILKKAPVPTPTPSPSPSPTVMPTAIPTLMPTGTPPTPYEPLPSATIGTRNPTSTPSPTPSPTSFPSITPSPTPTPTLVTVTPPVTPIRSSFFVDVPEAHWAYAPIKALYDDGYVAGCSTEPLTYCPEEGMRRDEASVFVVRGVEGAEYVPSEPDELIFADILLSEWHAKWISKLEEGRYTAGCGVNEKGETTFCPYDPYTRAEATVFFLRMLYGPEYVPPAPQPDRDMVYADVSVLAEDWYIKWVYAASDMDLADGCEDELNQADDLFRPGDVITRAEAACMMARAVGLE